MALLKLKCAQCGRISEELTDAADVGALRCEMCGGALARCYEGKALFGQVRKDLPERCEGCPRGRGGCPH